MAGDFQRPACMIVGTSAPEAARRSLQLLTVDDAMTICAEALKVIEPCARAGVHLRHRRRCVMHFDTGIAERPEALGGNETTALAEEATVLLREAPLFHLRQAGRPFAAQVLHADG
jgi:hypothetical protein